MTTSLSLKSETRERTHGGSGVRLGGGGESGILVYEEEMHSYVLLTRPETKVIASRKPWLDSETDEDTNTNIRDLRTVLLFSMAVDLNDSAARELHSICVTLSSAKATWPPAQHARMRASGFLKETHPALRNVAPGFIIDTPHHTRINSALEDLEWRQSRRTKQSVTRKWPCAQFKVDFFLQQSSETEITLPH